MSNPGAVKKASSVLEHVFGGKVADLSADQFAQKIPELEEQVATASARCVDLETKIKAEAVNAVGGAEGLARLASLRETMKPYQEERDLLQEALQGARTLLAQKQKAEREGAISSARQAVERVLAARQKVAQRMDERINGLAADLQEFSALGSEVFEVARAHLSVSSVAGFRPTGNTGQGFQAFTAQHEVNLHLGYISGRLWVYDGMPPLMRGCPGFAGYTQNWHLQLLNDFEERYSRDHPAPAATQGAHA